VVTPNPSVERTSTSMARPSFTSFFAKRAMLVPASHLKR
jgi:hypothetical protein